MATEAQRKHMAALMDLLYEHRSQVHYPYHDIRTYLDLATYKMTEQQVTTLLRHGGQIQADCSEMVTEICRWAGLADPNGGHYAPSALHYTGSLLAHLPHYSDPKFAGVGALVVFGPGTGHHVAMVREPNAKDPLLFSQGSEPDPRFIRLSVERQYQPPGVTFLSIAHL